MSVDTSRLFVTGEGNGLRFFFDPVQINKDKKRELLGLIRGSGGVYVTSVDDADVVLSLCETDEAERYAKEHKSTAVVDYDWVRHCLSKGALATGGNWAGYLITPSEPEVAIKEEDGLQRNGLDTAAKSKLPSPVSPGHNRQAISPTSSVPLRKPPEKSISGNSELASPPVPRPQMVSPVARSPLSSSAPSSSMTPPSRSPEDFRGLLSALANIMPKNLPTVANPSTTTVSPTSPNLVSRRDQVSPDAPRLKTVANSSNPAPKLAGAVKPVSPASTNGTTAASASSVRSPLTDTAKRMSPTLRSASSRLPTPISLPSPSIKLEQFVAPQPSPSEIPVTLFTHPTEARPLKLYLVSDLSHHREYARVLQKYGAQLSLLADCDYAIVDQGSVRLHQVAGSGKPAVKPDWIVACHGQKKLVKPDDWTLKLDEDAPTTPVFKSIPAQTRPVPEPVPSTSRPSPAQFIQRPKLSIPDPPPGAVLRKAPTVPPKEPVKQNLPIEKGVESKEPVKGRNSPAPPPPSHIEKSKSGYAFTKEDENFFEVYAAWRRRRSPSASDQSILTEVAKLASHHTDTSWRNWHWRRSRKAEKGAAIENAHGEDLAENEDVGPAPDPPKSFLPRSDGEGALYTDHDESYVVAMGKWMLLRNPKVTIRDISEEVGRRAPHHTASGWNRHIGLWKLFYTERIFGVDSKEAVALRVTEQAKDSAKKNATGNDPSPTRSMRKRPSSSNLESSKPRKSHKAIAQTPTKYMFPQPTNPRRGSVAFTHADLQLVVAHIEKNPKLDRLDDKLWIRYAEEHPQFTWREWKDQVRKSSELIEQELAIRKQEYEEEEAQEEEEEVDMEIGDSD